MSLTCGVLQVHRYYGNEKVCSVAQELYSAMKSSFVTPGQPAPMRGQGVGRGRPMTTARGGAGGHAPSRFGNRAGGKGKRGKSAPVKVSCISHDLWLLVGYPCLLQVAPRRSVREKQAVDYSQMDVNGDDDQTVPSLSHNHVD